MAARRQAQLPMRHRNRRCWALAAFASAVALAAHAGAPSFARSVAAGTSRRDHVLRRAEAADSNQLVQGIAKALNIKKEQLIEDVEKVELETPIQSFFDTLLGKKESGEKPKSANGDFIDSSDEANYVTVTVEKPLGVGLGVSGEEGGVTVTELKPGSNAEQTGLIEPGFQLVMAGSTPVHGLPMDKIIEIVGNEPSPVRLTFFKGPAKFFYGTLGPSSQASSNLILPAPQSGTRGEGRWMEQSAW